MRVCLHRRVDDVETLEIWGSHDSTRLKEEGKADDGKQRDIKGGAFSAASGPFRRPAIGFSDKSLIYLFVPSSRRSSLISLAGRSTCLVLRWPKSM